MHTFCIIHADKTVRDNEIDKRIQKEGISTFDVVTLPPTGSLIGIAETKSFIRALSLSPLEGNLRAGVIREADRLTLEAQSALLKTLEEPPIHVRLFLGTSNASNILPTILSRCATETISRTTKEKKEIDQAIFRHISPGKTIQRLALIAKTKEEYEAWIDDCMIALHEDVVSNSTILKKLLWVKRFLPNNVHPQFLLEHALFTLYNEG